MVKLLALDINTRQTGTVLFEHGALVARQTLISRGVDQMALCIENALDRIAPDVIAIEAAYMGENAHSYGLLCELNGMVRLWCMRHRKDMVKLTTSQIDRATGVRGDRKAGNRALAKYELETIDPARRITEHECDSYALAIAAMGVVKSGEWAKEQA